MVDAVVLAGGTIPDDEAAFRAAVGVDCKSLIPLAGKIMVSHVVEALKSATNVRRIAVVGPPSLRDHSDLGGADLILPEGAGRSENLFLALDAFDSAEQVLMMTSDTPLATGPMIDDLLDHFARDVEFGYTIVSAEAARQKFGHRPPPPPEPDGKQMPSWVTVAIADGEFTGTPCMLCRPEALRTIRSVIKGIFDNREMSHVVRVLGGALGYGFLLRAGLALRFRPCRHWLSIAAIEKQMSRGLKLHCRAYVSPYPELAFDVDHFTDVPLAEAELQGREA